MKNFEETDKGFTLEDVEIVHHNSGNVLGILSLKTAKTRRLDGL